MNTSTKTYLIGGGILSVVFAVVSAIVVAVYLLGIYNDQASQQNLYNMKVKDNSSEFDNMWKKISQVCQLADTKKDAFKEIFTSYADSRTPEGAGKMMFWVKENAPNLDLNVYDKAQNIIVASRDGWTMRQKELVAIATVYNNNLAIMPRGAILKFFGFKPIDPNVITSSRTEKAFETGKDDDVNIKPTSTNK